MEDGITNFLVQTDSHLISNQVGGEFQTKDQLLIKYLQIALNISQTFMEFEINHDPREENVRANLLV